MKPMAKMLKAAMLVGLLAMLTMAGAPQNVAYGQNLEKVTVRFTWKLKGEYAPLYVALEKGYYKAEGLDVQLSEGNGAQNVLKALAAGNEKFGYGPAVAAAQAVSQGLPVKVVALYQTSAPMGVIAFPETPLKGPKDLEGKRLAISVGETFGDMIRPFTRVNNVDLSKIQLIQMDASARTMQFLTRKIDVMSVYLSNELPAAREARRREVQRDQGHRLRPQCARLLDVCEQRLRRAESRDGEETPAGDRQGLSRRDGGPERSGEDDGEAYGGAGAAGRARSAGRGHRRLHQCPGRKADRLAG